MLIAVICVPLATPSAVWNNLPSVGSVTIVNDSVSPASGSVPVSVIALSVSSAADTACAVAVGSSLSGVTLIVMVLGDTLSVSPSLTVKSKES